MTVDQVLCQIQSITKPGTTGPYNSIRLEVMCVETCYVSANNFAQGVTSYDCLF